MEARKSNKDLQLIPPLLFCNIEYILRDVNSGTEILISRHKFQNLEIFYGLIRHQLRFVHWSHYVMEHPHITFQNDIKLLLYTQLYYAVNAHVPTFTKA